MAFTFSGRLIQPIPTPIIDNCNLCPLALRPEYLRVVVPNYLLTEVVAPLVKGPFFGFQVPENIIKSIRADLNDPEVDAIPTLNDILARVCGVGICNRCTPGVAWGHRENYFVVVPTLDKISFN